jgi:hypothetical protein
MEKGFDPLLVGKGPIAATATNAKAGGKVGLFSFVVAKCSSPVRQRLGIAINAVVGVCRRIHRCQKVWNLHSWVQQLNKISGSDALVLCYFQQFNESAFHNLGLGFCGLSNFIQGHLL